MPTKKTSRPKKASAPEGRTTTRPTKSSSPTTTTKTSKTKTTTKTTTKTRTKTTIRTNDPAEARETFARLAAAYPDAHCELDHRSVFELLVATILSAQSTDVGVNKVTPSLFARWPDADALSKASIPDVERAIGSIGMYRQKAKRIVEMAKLLVERHGGEVPKKLEDLVVLPGVGRKTANVVLGVWWNAPEGVVVDTHVQRITQRLGWTKHDDPAKIEQDLMKLLPRDQWDPLAHVLIFHGRRTCAARKPACDRCAVNDRCPSAFHAEDVGRKPPRTRT
jgi:endonuclease-3